MLPVYKMMQSAVKKASATTDSDSTTSSDSGESAYDPNYLDDPELRTGKHRTVIKLTGFLGSINHFTKADFLKRELNEKFRHMRPDVHHSLTLSQIRNLKRKLLKTAVTEGLEVSTVAKGWTFLEKLIMKRFVKKSNRRVVGACCLVAAAKATDSKAVNYKRLLDRLAQELAVSRAACVELEFTVLAALAFRLQLPESHYSGHVDRILALLDYSNLQEYLGERQYQNWVQHK